MYKIMRFYQDPAIASEVVQIGLSLDEARKWCKNPESSSRTSTNQDRTDKYGEWFEGYFEE